MRRTPGEQGAPPQVKAQSQLLMLPLLLPCPTTLVVLQNQFLLPKCRNDSFSGCPQTKPFSNE